MPRMHTLSGQIAFRRKPLLATLPLEYTSDRSLKSGFSGPDDDNSSKVLPIIIFIKEYRVQKHIRAVRSQSLLLLSWFSKEVKLERCWHPRKVRVFLPGCVYSSIINRYCNVAGIVPILLLRVKSDAVRGGDRALAFGYDDWWNSCSSTWVVAFISRVSAFIQAGDLREVGLHQPSQVSKK